MRKLTLTALALATCLATAPASAGPPSWGYRGGPGWSAGPGWGAGYYRPAYGWGGWRYGAPYYGYGYGLGFGTGAALGLALSAPFYTYPAYVPYSVVAAPTLTVQEPLTYVQQPPAETAEAAPPANPGPSYWYYCSTPAGYYPYVQQCSKPWIPVRPQ